MLNLNTPTVSTLNFKDLIPEIRITAHAPERMCTCSPSSSSLGTRVLGRVRAET